MRTRLTPQRLQNSLSRSLRPSRCYFSQNLRNRPHQAIERYFRRCYSSSKTPERKLKVVLINPNTRGDYRKGKIHTSNYGLAMLSAYLQKHNNAEVKIIDGRYKMLSPKEAYDQFKEFKPNLVGFSLLVDLSIDWSNRIISLIKDESPSTHVTLGSYFPSLLPEDAFKLVPNADTIVAGEGEVTLSDLADKIYNGLPWDKTPGLIFQRHDNKKAIVRTSHRDLINETDALPYPDRYMAKGDGRDYEAMIEATRGCLFHCSFCAVNSFDGLSKGSPIRTRSAQSLVSEFTFLKEKYPRLQGVRFVDSDFILPGTQNRAKEFAKLLEDRHVKIPFMFDIRAPSVIRYRDILVDLHKAGLQRVYMGIESGSADILKKMRKASTPEKNIEASKILKDLGIDYSYGFMMVTPWTNDSHIEENRYLLEHIGQIEFRSLFHEMTLIPGTHSYQEAQKLGELTWRGSLSYYTYKTLSPKVEKFRKIGLQFRKKHPSIFEAAGYIYESLRQLHRIGEYDKMKILQKKADDLFLAVFDACWNFSSNTKSSDQEVERFFDEFIKKFSPQFSSLLKEINPEITLENCSTRVPDYAPRYQI